MRTRDTLDVSRRNAAARKRIRRGRLQARFRFNHTHAFDDFWGEQLLDDIACAALVERSGELAGGAAALGMGRA